MQCDNPNETPPLLEKDGDMSAPFPYKAFNDNTINILTVFSQYLVICTQNVYT